MTQQQAAPLVVVTMDKDLKRRCRRAISQLAAAAASTSDPGNTLPSSSTKDDGENRLLRIVDSAAFAAWLAADGWDAYEVDPTADGLCHREVGTVGDNGDVVTPATAAAARKRRSKGGGGGAGGGGGVARELTADRQRLAHDCFDIVARVSSGEGYSRLATGPPSQHSAASWGGCSSLLWE